MAIVIKEIDVKTTVDQRKAAIEAEIEAEKEDIKRRIQEDIEQQIKADMDRLRQERRTER